MGDVLTNDQHLDDTKPWHNAPGYPRETDRAFMARMREAAADRNTVGKNDHSHMLTLYDRLVSEIERLRARNDALEQVAKAVRERGHHDTCQRVMLGTEYECVCGYALAEPGKGGAP